MIHRLRRAYLAARDTLLGLRHGGGHWLGELSTSALSTAVAISALALVRSPRRDLIDDGVSWLVHNANADGGWGDTTLSFSNISTTMLVRAAFHLTGHASAHPQTLAASSAWLAQHYGNTPAQLAEAIRRRYGIDRTFSVPILMTSALAGLVDWREVPALPFELACFPQSCYRLLQLPVVSYALPALIAIGQAVMHHRGTWNPIRRFAVEPSLRVLSRIQPRNGGFLEAAPLTAFVAMGLASTGKADHPVVKKCEAFLIESVRQDGSWPIDTNLSTWVTTLAINALAAAGDLEILTDKATLREWLLAQQYRQRHPFTGADPGAWAWTPLPGAVPDADDTPGALLALANLGHSIVPKEGLRWLLALQNADGGWPTFCRGWGKLPFDRSGSDLTAHALRALHRWTPRDPFYLRARKRALLYLGRHQRDDGSWLPLWFGNQHAADDINPTYGTAKVLAAYRDLGLLHTSEARRGLGWLRNNQNEDGSWGAGRGTPGSIEETALACEILLDAGDACERCLNRLIEFVESGHLHRPTPIGFYFAKLWYFEKLYPIVFTVAALGRAVQGVVSDQWAGGSGQSADRIERERWSFSTHGEPNTEN